MSLTLLYWILLGVMLIGVIGTLVPAIPGISLILIAILIWGFATGFMNLGIPLGVAIAVLILGTGIEFLATYWGARQMGASQWGQIGAILGLLLGLFGLLPALPFGGPLLGALIGPLLGAFLGEFLYRKQLDLQPRIKTAFKASIGILVGSLLGNLIEALLAVVAIAVFVFNTWSLLPGLS
ncbi:MAG: DUF456 family protein [Oculatellaceae cyanobacterium Prado106]|jgi:hypothetical protein|nr:DUF456 family protein [Oculatellaceae cyanobacterium Prado106]